MLIIDCFGWDVCYWLCSVYNSEPAFCLCFGSLHFKLVWRNCDCDLSWGDHVQWSSPVMVDKIYDIYWICMGTTHCATLGTTQNFETMEPIRREWCKLLKKARTANPSATTMLAVAQWQMSFFVKRLKSQGNVENVSQMIDKNSWGFCQRSNQKKTRSAYPFEGARYWLGCSRSTLLCHLSERLHLRGWQTPGNHQRH